MKNYIYTLSTLVIASSLAFAQDKPADPAKGGGAPGRGQRMTPEESFKKLDTNSDGSLSLDEYKANPRFQKDASKAEEGFKKADKDADGKMTLDEYKAARPTRRGGGDKGGATPPPAPK
jgi:hypothetical protein